MTILEFLYNTVPGRFLLKSLTGPRLSRICGNFLDSELSSFLIQPFVKQNAIQLSDYETTDIKSFNDFFSRKIKQGKRPIDMEENHLIAPCDGLLSVWKIKENTVFPVKQSHYTISSLLHSKKLAQRYHGGYCLVYRLCVNHYHRYCYVDSGQKSRNFFIPGRLHTVRPVALREVPVFTENSREYTLIRTEKFGTVVQMEVGAMLVGRIVNHEEKGSTIRGKEKGYFQYGGSTIIVLIEPEQVQIREDILQSSALTKEVPVKMGEVIKERFNNLLPRYAILPIIAALLINNCIYIGAAQLRNHLSFYSLAISLDEKIPLLTPFVIFYVLAYVQWALNYILIGRDSKKLCYQFVLGDILSKVICLFFFILFPTTLTRPEITGTDIFSQLVRFIYSVDAPVNLFPSIHCLESWCCIRAAYKMNFKTEKRTNYYRVATILMSLGIFASTLFIKQHVIADVFGGIAAFEIGMILAKILI